MQIASQANTGLVTSLLRPSHEAGSGLQKGPSIWDKQDSRAVYSVPAAMLDPMDPAENTAVSTDRCEPCPLLWIGDPNLAYGPCLQPRCIHAHQDLYAPGPYCMQKAAWQKGNACGSDFLLQASCNILEGRDDHSCTAEAAAPAK